MISPHIRAILCCPACKGELEWGRHEVQCQLCQERYAVKESGALDLRLKTPKRITVPLEIAGDGRVLDAFDALSSLPMHSNPKVEFELAKIPRHVTRQMLTHFTRARDASELALDLGCGSTVSEKVPESAMVRWPRVRLALLPTRQMSTPSKAERATLPT